MSQLLLLIFILLENRAEFRLSRSSTNGKTTTTRLARIVKNNEWFKVGFTTSDGIYIQNHMMEKEILQALKVHNMLERSYC
jgi:hypothetical protein